MLEPHQQIRIKVVLGMEEDLAGAGYNVNQSKIAIGCRGADRQRFLEWYADKAEVCAGARYGLHFLHRG